MRLDHKFDKSYGRLIQSCLQIKNINMADYIANQMKVVFNQETRDKYKEYLTLLEIEKNKEDENLKKIMSKTMAATKKEQKEATKETTKSEDKDSLNTSTEKKAAKPAKNKWVKWLMGSLLFGSFTSLVLLVTFRNKFKTR